MKITPDQLAALQLQQKNTARNPSGEGFAQALAQELAPGSSAEAGAAACPTSPVVRLDQAFHQGAATAEVADDILADLEQGFATLPKIPGIQE